MVKIIKKGSTAEAGNKLEDLNKKIAFW